MSHLLVKQFSIPVFDLSKLHPKLVRRCTLEMQSQQLCPCVTGCLRAEQRAECSKNLPGLGSVLRPLHFWNMSFFPPLSLLLMSADIRKSRGKTASVYFTANKWPCCWPPSQWPWEHLRCGQWGMCMVPACRRHPGRLHPAQPGHCLCSSYWCHLVSFWDEAGVALCRQMDKGFCFLCSPSDLVACSRCYHLGNVSCKNVVQCSAGPDHVAPLVPSSCMVLPVLDSRSRTALHSRSFPLSSWAVECFFL